MLALPFDVLLHLEDEPIVAMEIADSLRQLGVSVVHSVSNAQEALHLVGSGSVEIAILDVGTREADCMAVADHLSDAGVPFLFYSGMQQDDWLIRYPGAAWLSKPSPMETLLDELGRLANTAAQRRMQT